MMPHRTTLVALLAALLADTPAIIIVINDPPPEHEQPVALPPAERFPFQPYPPWPSEVFEAIASPAEALIEEGQRPVGPVPRIAARGPGLLLLKCPAPEC